MGDCVSKFLNLGGSSQENQPTQSRTSEEFHSVAQQTSSSSKMTSAAASQLVTLAATARHTATIIFMHGLGDTGHGWAPVFQQIKQPHIKYILPTAPTIPVSLNMGMQMPSWFDIKGLSANAPEDGDGIKRACSTVQSLIDAEIAGGIASNRIMLGGFSQGGGLALYSGLTYDKPLAGIIAFSCWLPLHETLPGSHQANLNTPILQCHGDEDPLIVLPIGKMSAKYLESMNAKNHSFKIYSGMGHSSCDEEIKDMKKFIQQCLP